MGALYRLKTLSGFVHPTYGNTMYHTGMVRLMVETGLMPAYDLSYGALMPNFYVPAYRLFAAALSVLSGNDAMAAAAMFVVLLGAATIASAYLLGKELGGEGAGLAAAFLFVLSPEMTIYTIRAFPQALGIPFFLLALYFLKRKNAGMCVLAAVLTTMSHQATAVALGAVLLIYSVLRRDRIALLALASSAAAYGIWQLHALGSLDIAGMRQIALRESGEITMLSFERIGVFAIALLPFGAVAAAKNWKNHALAISFVLAGIVLAKNDLLGLGVFMDRFFTFLAMGLIFLAAVGAARLWEISGAGKWR